MSIILKLPRIESGDIGVSWMAWIVAHHVLLKETRELVEQAD